MRFKVFSNLRYDVLDEGTIILNVHAQRSATQTVLEETLEIEPYFKAEELSAPESGSRFLRLDVKPVKGLDIRYQALVDNSFEEVPVEDLTEVSIGELPLEVLAYLNPSRYCQSDKLYRFANNKFGNSEPGFKKVLDISNWIHANVEYLSGSTNAQTSAYDTVTELAGVCRDFAHLGVALCRALSIPARYFTGYSYLLKPADFHACFEAFLGGKWIVFDATQLSPLNGLIKIGTGRDAAESPVASLFGGFNYLPIAVNCELSEGEFTPVFYNEDTQVGLSYG